MPVVRVAVASTPLTATLAEALPAAVAAVEEAGRLGAAIVCLPEAALPGHRLQQQPVQDMSERELDDALGTIAEAVKAAGVAAVVGAERPTAKGRRLVAVVFDADGTRLGEQEKTQIALEEELAYVPGSGRRLFTAAAVPLAVAICHEAFRYPELARSAALAGARVLFVPHYVAGAGSLPQRWCDAASSYHEKALLCRALENTIYVAQANVACSDQGSASCIVGPEGELLAQVPYGEVGVAAVDLDLERASALLARRWAPERARPAERA